MRHAAECTIRSGRLAAGAAAFALLLTGCAPAPEPDTGGGEPQRIVSLDYCADQYVLRFAEREAILALSPFAGEHFSYMRAEAEGLPTVRPRTADILALQPDLVVRSFGGGPDIVPFLEQLGVPVIQIGFPQTIADVREEVLRVGTMLGAEEEARRVAEDMDRRLAALPAPEGPAPAALYMTPGGMTSGEGTLVHEILRTAGLANFQKRPGWNTLPLEWLAYERPDVIAAAFYEGGAGEIYNWSAARHPVARAQLENQPVVPLEGAWTSCGGWFLVDAIEALAQAAEGSAT